MRMIALVIPIFALLAGCTQQPPDSVEYVVPEKELSELLALAEARQYHRVANTGGALLKKGLIIRDHRTKLKAFRSNIPKSGHVRYELMSFKGGTGIFEITLFLKEDTGEIVNFFAFEGRPGIGITEDTSTPDGAD